MWNTSFPFTLDIPLSHCLCPLSLALPSEFPIQWLSISWTLAFFNHTAFLDVTLHFYDHNWPNFANFTHKKLCKAMSVVLIKSMKLCCLKRYNSKSQVPTSIKKQGSPFQPVGWHQCKIWPHAFCINTAGCFTTIHTAVSPSIPHILFYQTGQKQGKSSTEFSPNTSGK